MYTKEHSINDVDFVVFDLETTGLRHDSDRILEIGAVKARTTGETDSYQSFIDIASPIPSEATQINGITNEMIAGAPPSQEVLKTFLAFIENSVIVAHNIGFDFRFLNAELTRHGYNTLSGLLLVDTLSLARKALPNLSKYSLEHITKAIGIEVGEYHRALDDARGCKEVLFHCCDQLSMLGELSLSEIII